MEEKRFTVGEVSKITGISKDTLRFYDKIKLFQPALKDDQNGYRYYSVHQFWYIDMITCFRKLGLPIKRIKSILSSADNQHIVDVLNEEKQHAAQMRDYYAGVVDDIEWYCNQNKRIASYGQVGQVCVREMTERRVIYGANQENEKAYHIKLQQNCQEEVLHADSIKRHYGYVLHPELIQENQFRIRGEYIEIGSGQYQYTDPHHILAIPAGEYACFVTNVCGEQADFSPLCRWLADTGRVTEFIIADEIGLQLFYYNQFSYPCEIKALLRPETHGL